MANQNLSDSTYAGLQGRHIATNMAQYEAARSSFFVLMVGNLDNLLKPNYHGGIDDGDAKNHMYNQEVAEETLRLNILKAPVPSYEVSVLEYKRGNDVVRFAGNPTWSQGGSFTVDDVVGADTKSLLYAWLRLAYDPNTLKGGRMVNYKKPCKLMEYTQDYQLIRTWIIEGVFITKIDEGEFDREADGKRQLTVTFSYDKAIPEHNYGEDR